MDTSLPTVDIAKNVSSATLEGLVSPVMTLAVPLIYVLVFVCSTPCNLLSLWALLSINYKHQTSTSVLAINLSLSDLLYSVFLPLQVLYHLKGNDWSWGSALCGLSTTAFHCNMHCSILTTTAIAFERYCGVVHPLSTKHWRTARRATIICFLTWVVVLVTQTPLIKTDLTLRVEELNITTCFDVVPRKMFSTRSLAYLYFGSTLMVFYMLPLIVLVGCYIAVARGLWRSVGMTASGGNEKNVQSRRRVLNVVTLAGVCFVVCYLPTITLQAIHFVYISRNGSLYVYYKLALAINSFNCCFDPFVYYFASRQFRLTLQNKLERWCRCYGTLESRDSGMSDLGSG